MTTSNHLSGFVEFATAPTPNQTGKQDWIAYSLTDGVRTLSSAAGDHQFFLSDFFDFDASLNIINWQFSIVPDSQVGNNDVIFTSLNGDSSRLNLGLDQQAINSQGGTWTTDFEPTPEPASLALLGLGLAGLGWSRRKK